LPRSLLVAVSAGCVHVECTRTDAPRLTPSIRIALEDLGLAQVAVIHPGHQGFALSARVEAVPLEHIGRGDPLFAGTGA
jgi:uncharacterized protein